MLTLSLLCLCGLWSGRDSERSLSGESVCDLFAGMAGGSGVLKFSFVLGECEELVLRLVRTIEIDLSNRNTNRSWSPQETWSPSSCIRSSLRAPSTHLVSV